jgi:hypothetical protein
MCGFVCRHCEKNVVPKISLSVRDRTQLATRRPSYLPVTSRRTDRRPQSTYTKTFTDHFITMVVPEGRNSHGGKMY